MNSYRDLLAWQKSMSMVTEVYKTIDRLPYKEEKGLKDQMRRSAVSVPSNIAEGFGRNSKLEFIRFLNIAKGSLCELETQISLSQKLSYIDKEEEFRLLSLTGEISKILLGLVRSMKEE